MRSEGSAVATERRSESAPSSRRVRILHLEDDRNDAVIAHTLLSGDGLACEIERVETREDFEAALDRGGFDLIISDFSLPMFDGISALAIARKKCPDVPFIFLSGAIGEETAVASLQAGATDYVVKQRLARLPAAVRRALREAEERAERKRLEDHLRQSQKMEAIGRLTGGIAHDFNNLLTVINGYSEMSLQSLKADDALRPNLEQIKEAGERAAGLTRQLLAFSRRQVLEPKVLDLNAVVTNVEKLLNRMIGEDVILAATRTAGLGRVKADPSQIEQVLMNLAVNARDAMPAGGKLTIETANVELDESYAREHMTVQPGRYVMLAVSDTGCGMDVETQKRIFEPFFTTKEQGKGTGLGLSTVYGIVKQSGGYIWAYSEVGLGTTFKVYLPRVDAAIAAVEPAREVLRTARGAETVLLAEDDPALRSLLRKVLQENGYTVLEAFHGKHAVEVCEQHSGPIHLMVTDVVMPEMGGTEAAGRLSSLRPDLKVLFLSGYADDAVHRHGVLAPGTAFLQKPFVLETLARKVREVLDASGPE